MRCVVLTGCSGGGKSSLLDVLARRGLLTVPEAGRMVVRAECAAGGDALPWKDVEAFLHRAASVAVAQFDAVCRGSSATGDDHGRAPLAVFDRSLVDIVSHFDYLGRPVPQGLAAELRRVRYAMDVLVAPPWPEIYDDDGERCKTFADAVSEYTVLMRRYAAEGYRLTPLPRQGLAERAAFCMRFLYPDRDKETR